MTLWENPPLIPPFTKGGMKKPLFTKGAARSAGGFQTMTIAEKDFSNSIMKCPGYIHDAGSSRLSDQPLWGRCAVAGGFIPRREAQSLSTVSLIAGRCSNHSFCLKLDKLALSET